ncbi:aminoglycoside phosphotransferase family protein [Microcoleus sp. herbarium12]|uniref:aminoglycoside phosphotransferase family protein n=1 Tax=Microcoleus sp. herbarium12 TaxID=3055437 RepID=UPI002FCECE73
MKQPFVLTSQNVFEYLVRQALCTDKEVAPTQIEQKFAKNFNLLVTCQDGRRLLVKQERCNLEGKTTSELKNEWLLHEFFQNFPKLNSIRLLISEIVQFDAERAIAVFNYLNNYSDLANFYVQENVFNPELLQPIQSKIAPSIGATLAIVHKATWNSQEYRDFFCQNRENLPIDKACASIRGLERIEPEIFGLVPADSLKFFALYQRYDSLGKAIAELISAMIPCCLTHNDLKLNNILLHKDWEQIFSSSEPSNNSIIRLIDWERCGWGNPAFDLGMLIANYLQIWLNSLVISPAIELETSLANALIPLAQLQPSLAAIAGAYFDNFPEIVEKSPDFLKRVVQCSGLALIQYILAALQYKKTFGNTGICMLQIAKSLLCRPERSISIVFGNDSKISSILAF